MSLFTRDKVYISADKQTYLEHNAGTGITSMVVGGTTVWTASTNSFDSSFGPVLVGASLTLVAATHEGRTIYLDQATGSAATLPAATGSGTKFRIVVSTTVTSGSSTIACAGTDEFAGVVYQVDTDTSDTVVAYPALAADDFDVITMNGTTTGGLQGDWYEVEDISTGVWALLGYQNANGTVLTPLSST
jgi:hypothetical protein